MWWKIVENHCKIPRKIHHFEYKMILSCTSDMNKCFRHVCFLLKWEVIHPDTHWLKPFCAVSWIWKSLGDQYSLFYIICVFYPVLWQFLVLMQMKPSQMKWLPEFALVKRTISIRCMRVGQVEPTHHLDVLCLTRSVVFYWCCRRKSSSLYWVVAGDCS